MINLPHVHSDHGFMFVLEFDAEIRVTTVRGLKDDLSYPSTSHRISWQNLFL